jgi:hypothetical protein
MLFEPLDAAGAWVAAGAQALRIITAMIISEEIMVPVFRISFSPDRSSNSFGKTDCR